MGVHCTYFSKVICHVVLFGVLILLVHVFVGNISAIDEPRAEREAGCVREEDDSLRESERCTGNVRPLHVLTAKENMSMKEVTSLYGEVTYLVGMEVAVT